MKISGTKRRTYPVVHLPSYFLRNASLFRVGFAPNPNVNDPTVVLFVKRYFQNVTKNNKTVSTVKHRRNLSINFKNKTLPKA